MSEAPYNRSALINAIAEEGTKAEAVEYLQKNWNELCEAHTRIRELEAEKEAAEASRDEFRRMWKAACRHAEDAEAEAQALHASIRKLGATTEARAQIIARNRCVVSEAEAAARIRILEAALRVMGVDPNTPGGEGE